jgi:predicted MPP superfamily phosphohydrolase
LLGGDLVTGRPDELGDVLPALARLVAPLGVFAVVGNHDRYALEVRDLDARLASAGVKLLVNGHVELTRSGDRLVLAGIDDWITGYPDLAAALDGANEHLPVVLLSHNPDAAFEAATRGVGLVLSGHTHAGQIRVPGLPVLVRMSRYRLDEGRYRTPGGTEIVVSRGIGVVGVPVRIACPPEVVLITLRPGAT